MSLYILICESNGLWIFLPNERKDIMKNFAIIAILFALLVGCSGESSDEEDMKKFKELHVSGNYILSYGIGEDPELWSLVQAPTPWTMFRVQYDVENPNNNISKVHVQLHRIEVDGVYSYPIITGDFTEMNHNGFGYFHAMYDNSGIPSGTYQIDMWMEKLDGTLTESYTFEFDTLKVLSSER